MFSTCLFCHTSLGANQRIEHFPIGRRLAFDAERGRLWAVCPNCARWNLTPLEERWEAIEECERAYRDTKQRVSTDHVGLAVLKDGTDLVRIGQPLLPEFAAWRYARKYRRRRMPGSLLIPFALYWHTLARIALPNGSHVPVTWWQACNSHSAFDGQGELRMELVHSGTMRLGRDRRNQQRTALVGQDAIRAVRDVIVTINRGAQAGSRVEVDAAVRVVEQSIGGQGATAADGCDALRAIERYLIALRGNSSLPIGPNSTTVRFAIEIALHETDERRALAGELGALYARWEAAERIAKIADGELSSRFGADPR